MSTVHAHNEVETIQKSHKIIAFELKNCFDDNFYFTPILTHTWQGKKLQAISATQLLKMDTRTTEILSFKKICRAVFEIDRFKVFPLVNFTQKKG